MRHSINAIILCTGILLSAPVYAAPGEVLLDEITIRIIENEKTPFDVNDIALPRVRGKSNDKRQGPSENADERASQGAENAAEAAENAAENAAEAAENAKNNAAETREKATETANKGKGKGKGRNK